MVDPIVVIGAGIAGASTAYHLTGRTDRPVRVIERGAIAAETTGKSTAVFRFHGEPTLDRMKRYALETFNEFLADAAAMTEYEPLGGRLEVATSEAAAEDVRAVDAPIAAHVDPADLDETLLFPQLATDVLEAAVFLPNAGYFRPTELTFEFVERAEKRGATFVEGTTVRGVSTEGGRVTGVETDSETIEARAVVSAAGPWNLQVGRSAGVELPIRHTLAPILRLEPLADRVTTIPNIVHEDTGYYLRGSANGEVLVGHSPGDYEAGTEYDPATVSNSVPAEIRKNAIDVIELLVPSLIDSDIVEEWAGVRSRIPDERPMVGPAGPDGLYFVAFHSEGLQLATAAGRRVAEIVTGESDPGDLSPERFENHPDADF
ncbi:Glycine/D-amino acid oxidase (deaminating) [Halanaeroarchaeum sp. HSR-CO]|uniref:NAD(P)/FAD-dependent oxidoreductase n=1 Tax=Halanaeroarchaeum sp. HSR-CO TaxID=2866382 RepID=UPI00217E247E|nr:FAD-dependent oxidoreductase [Halanaeroarchaeum sp. HSR-CO]UWG46377.1 Glycine/D-amino acid oxidase (deaminating) [Halanaeroarchaeum sp. HSR-CO]